ncbi:hypothetical protein PAHAL_5G007600 [Panicum hallii]|uniref:Uncharacterized protein n=1 Tax=Panicum hallii TaxID=206008 RepID=A0A2T8IID9_9POAL|nr:hypothetical protein PAHAL_5G007600 [Panicum hallii]
MTRKHWKIRRQQPAQAQPAQGKEAMQSSEAIAVINWWQWSGHPSTSSYKLVVQAVLVCLQKGCRAVLNGNTVIRKAC